MLSFVFVFLRYGALLGARALGLLGRAVFGGWRRPLVALAAASAALWLVARPLPFPDAWFSPLNALLLFLGLALARWVWTARRRLVVANFVDYRGGQPKPDPGLSALLVVELARLYDLYRVVDETRADPEAVRAPQNIAFDEERTLEEVEQDRNVINHTALVAPAPIRAEEMSDVLDAAVGTDATVGLGPIKVPIGALAALVGRIARGPRLTGTVHRQGSIVVTARTVGTARALTWRVDGKPPGETAGEPTEQPEELLDELAVRLFTDLTLEGAVKWRATWAYVNGLRAYRNCLRTTKDRRLNLEKAKECFIETLVEDDTFDLAHYNLGVVATELGQTEAAEAAFSAAIERNNCRWEPYYGLAQLYLAQGRYEKVLPLCGRMLRLGRHRAETYHLRALAARRRGDIAGAMADRRAAVRWAWLRLCGEAVRGRESPETRRLAATALRNLAGLRAYDAKERTSFRRALGYRAAERELRQGAFLSSSDAELYFELGKIHAARRKWRAAVRHLERAVEIAPDRPRFWIQLARAQASFATKRADDARFASSRALEQPSQIIDAGFDRLIHVFDRIGDKEMADRVRRLRDFERQRRAWKPDSPAAEELERQLQEFRKDKALWQVAQVCLHLAQRYVDEKRGDGATKVAECLASELENLRTRHPREVKRQDIYAVAAQALQAAGREEEALEYAAAAVVHNPLSCRARTVLAELHLALGHFDQAQEAWRAALACQPDDPAVNLRMGECLVRSALEYHEIGRRSPMLEEAARHLENAVVLYELSGTDDRTDQQRETTTKGKGRARFWLARALFELDEYERAIAQLRLSLALDDQRLLAKLRLGVAYVRIGALVEGEREFEEIEREVAGASGDETVGPAGDQLTARQLQAWARVHHISSQIEREARLHDSLNRLEMVRHDVEKLSEPARTGLLAACADWEGWALFKLGETERALACLTKSSDLQPTAEVYLHLAVVHTRRAVNAGTPVERQRDEERARYAATLARRLGLGSQQAQILDEELCRLHPDPADDGVGSDRR